jgi:hypothetical protein
MWPGEAPEPSHELTFCDERRPRHRVVMSWLMPWMRVASSRTSTLPGSATSPSREALRIDPMRMAVAVIVFDGMQSHRCAAPPMMSFSTRVTDAPSDAAVEAACVPPGPPPMIRNRVLTRNLISPGLEARRSSAVSDRTPVAARRTLRRWCAGPQSLAHRRQEVGIGTSRGPSTTSSSASTPSRLARHSWSRTTGIVPSLGPPA